MNEGWRRWWDWIGAWGQVETVGVSRSRNDETASISSLEPSSCWYSCSLALCMLSGPTFCKRQARYIDIPAETLAIIFTITIIYFIFPYTTSPPNK